MKLIGWVLLGGLVLAASPWFVHAQAVSASTASDELSDTAVMLQAIAEAAPPVPASSVPELTGPFLGFYSAQNPNWPPLPGNVLGFDVWNLGDGVYLLDDRQFDYVALSESLQLAAQLDEELTASASMMNLSVAYASASDFRPYLTNLVGVLELDETMTMSFDIAGGTNFVPYDIITATNLTDPLSTWTWLGIGYTANNYTFTNQPYDVAFYALGQPQNTMTVAWGNNQAGEAEVPYGLSKAVQVAGGFAFNMALLSDGSVQAWGANNDNQTSVPTNLPPASMVAAGWGYAAALLTNGTVVAWGNGDPSFGLTNVPPDLTNATVIAAHSLHTLALREDGTVAAWGYDGYAGGSGVTNVPTGLSNVVAIAAGYQHNLVVKDDGSVVAWGLSNHGQSSVPAGATNVWDVAAGPWHSVALRRDGTVICWGNNTHGECDVPAGLSNVVAIAAGGDWYFGVSHYTMALKADGTVAIWGSGESLEPVMGLSNVISIAAGTHHALALRTGPKTPVLVELPQDQYQVVGGNVTFAAEATAVYGVNYQWQYGGVDLLNETNATLVLNSVQVTNEGVYRVIATNEVGSIVSSNVQFYLVTAPALYSKNPGTNPVAYYQSDVALSVTALAPGQDHGFPLSYQWQFNGTNVAGATGPALSFPATNGTAGQYSLMISNAAGSTNATWDVSINYGTLAYYLATNTAAYTNGHTASSNDMVVLAGATFAYYTNGNLELLTNATWSTNCWLHGVQGLSATAIGVLNSEGGRYVVTMVSPRHYLFATHIDPLVRRAAFLDTNNVIYWRTPVEEVAVGTDTSVGIFDEDLPASVGYLQVLPPDYTNYLPTSASMPVQGIGMNQYWKAFGEALSFGTPNPIEWYSTNAVPFSLGTSWNVNIIGGDSSCPVRILVGNQLVIVSHNWQALGAWAVGPNYASQFDAINEKMHYLSTNNNLGTNYQLTPHSLTNWPAIQ